MQWIEERTRPGSDGPAIWHLAHARGTSEFRRIKCSKDEGIVFPGHTRDEPGPGQVCPDCAAAAASGEGENE